jgi:predicted nucleotidyltransferase
MASPDVVKRAGETLASAAGDSAKVILFGSHARGEARPDSDLDFLVIERRIQDRHKEWVRLRRALGDIQVPVDLLVLDERRASRRAKVPGTTVYHALRDGRVISHP